MGYRLLPDARYRRRRLLVGVVALVLVVGLIRGIVTLLWPHPEATPSAAAMPAPAAQTIPPRQDGIWSVATEKLAPTDGKTTRVLTYAVLVETALGMDAQDVARQVHVVLDDTRGWRSRPGLEGTRFRLVDTPDAADIVIHLASPAQVDRLCAPLQTEGTWSCRNGKNVMLNSDRWTSMTPTWAHHDVAEYRAYMVNHEVGHFLGLDHVPCPKPGAPAPVMLQQSMDLGGCVTNPWPATTG